MLEAKLIYRPEGAPDRELTVATARDPTALRAVRDAAVREALAQYQVWAGVHEAVAALERGEATKLFRVLDLLLPEDRPSRPTLRRLK
jgi:hypothetical protein